MSASHSQGTWVGGNGSSCSWNISSSSSQSGQPGSNGNNQYSCNYLGVDGNGGSYACNESNGAYQVNIVDAQGRQHTYSGPGGAGRIPGQPPLPGQSGYIGTRSYASAATNQQGQNGSSQSSCAWKTFM